MRRAGNWRMKNGSRSSPFIARRNQPCAIYLLSAEVLAILCCPEMHQGLARAGGDLVQEINRKIAAGALKNRAGQLVTEPLDGALLREDRQYMYAVRGDVPVLLV